MSENKNGPPITLKYTAMATFAEGVAFCGHAHKFHDQAQECVKLMRPVPGIRSVKVVTNLIENRTVGEAVQRHLAQVERVVAAATEDEAKS